VQILRSEKLLRLTYLAAAFAIALVFVSCADNDDNDYNGNQDRNTDHQASAEFAFAFHPSTLTSFSLDAINGEVEIHCLADSLIDSIRVSGERRVESDSDADAQEHLQYLYVLTNVDEHVLNVRTDQPGQTDGRNYIVDYYIEIPENMPVTASNVNGPVWIDNVQVAVTASTVNGNLRLGGTGIAVAHVVNGYLSIESHRGNMEGTVVNGGIHAEALLLPQGICSLTITNGNIDLQIPDTTSAHLNANVVNGGIEVRDIPFTSGIVGPDRVNAVFGDGDGLITLSSVNGNILVRPFGI
jgi:hypothetical protein